MAWSTLKRIQNAGGGGQHVAWNDWYEMVDVSDTADHASGTSKKIRAGRVGWVFPDAQPAQLGTLHQNYYGQLGVNASATLQMVTDRIILQPFVVHKQIVITELGIMVSGTPGASNVRLGIYNTNRQWASGLGLLVNANSVDTGSTGKKTLTGLSINMAPGPYFLFAVSTGTPTLDMAKTVPLANGGLVISTTSVSASGFMANYLMADSAGSYTSPPSTLPAYSVQAFGTTMGHRAPIWMSWEVP